MICNFVNQYISVLKEVQNNSVGTLQTAVKYGWTALKWKKQIWATPFVNNIKTTSSMPFKSLAKLNNLNCDGCQLFETVVLHKSQTRFITRQLNGIAKDGPLHTA